MSEGRPSLGYRGILKRMGLVLWADGFSSLLKLLTGTKSSWWTIVEFGNIERRCLASSVLPEHDAPLPSVRACCCSLPDSYKYHSHMMAPVKTSICDIQEIGYSK